jgi:D-glycero-D-manno-heptose 1,7-bisphosphate phosphatase
MLRKTLFLDRDGVINVNHGFVFKADDIDFIDGIFQLCRHAKAKGYQIIIVTNQSGLARKYYSREEFLQLSKWLKHKFWQQGINIHQTLHCPHHPRFTHACVCRKPRPGMIVKAIKRFSVDTSRSCLIGDKLSDIKCALAAGIKTPILFQQHKERHQARLRKSFCHQYYQASNLHAIAAQL